MTTTREAKAAEILKAHRAAARVAKARQLSTAFDAECREAERPVGFWQQVGYIHGVLRHKGGDGYAAVLALAFLLWIFIKAFAFIWLLVKASLVLIPAWLFLWLTRSGPYRRRRMYYQSW